MINGNRFLISHYELILGPKQYELNMAGKQIT